MNEEEPDGYISPDDCGSVIVAFLHARSLGLHHPKNPGQDTAVMIIWAEWFAFGFMGIDMGVGHPEANRDSLPIDAADAYWKGVGYSVKHDSVEGEVNDIFSDNGDKPWLN